MAKKKAPTNKPPRARRTAEDQLKLAREKVAKLEADAKATAAKAKQRKAAGPSPRILNAIGRDYRLLVRARARLQVTGAEIGLAPTRSTALAHINATIADLRQKWTNGYRQKVAYVEASKDDSELKRVQKLEDGITEEATS